MALQQDAVKTEAAGRGVEKNDSAKMPALPLDEHFKRAQKLFDLANSLRIESTWRDTETQLKGYLDRQDKKADSLEVLKAKYMLGVALLAQGKAAEAKPLLSEYLAAGAKGDPALQEEAVFRRAEAAAKAAMTSGKIEELKEARDYLANYTGTYKTGRFIDEAAKFAKETENSLSLFQGNKCYREKDYEQAIALLGSYVKNAPKAEKGQVDNRPIALATIAKCQGLQGKIKEARSALSQLDAEYPKSPLLSEAVGRIADQALSERKYELAREILAGSGPEHALRRAVTEHGLGKYAEAIAIYKDHLQRNPKDQQAQKLLQEASSALTTEQTNAIKTVFNNSLEQLKNGAHAEAAKGFRDVLAKSKDKSLLEKAKFCLIESELGARNLPEAASVAEDFLKSYSASNFRGAVAGFGATAMLESAKQLISAKQFEEAQAKCLDAREKFGDWAAPAFQVLTTLGDLEKARSGSGAAYYEHALKQFSKERCPEETFPELIELRKETEKKLGSESSK